MQDINSNNFGILIAYLLPGFIAVVGISFHSDVIRNWLTASSDQSPTVGGFLYVTVASLAMGLAISTLRWLVLDTIHHHTGISEPQRNFKRLQETLSAYQYLVQTHYDYYKFHGGMMLAMAFFFLAYEMSNQSVSTWMYLAFVALEWLFWLGMRDTLAKYYFQGDLLLQEFDDVKYDDEIEPRPFDEEMRQNRD